MPVALRLLPLALLLALPGEACAAGKEPMTAPDIETRLVLRNAAGKEADVFEAGEPIALVLIVRNRSGAGRTLTLPTSQTHECVVNAADGGEIWRWSRERMFAQVITELTLAAGASRTFTAVWDQTDAKGDPVPPGRYEAAGFVPGGAPGCRAAPVPLTIRPAPPR